MRSLTFHLPPAAAHSDESVFVNSDANPFLVSDPTRASRRDTKHVQIIDVSKFKIFVLSVEVPEWSKGVR